MSKLFRKRWNATFLEREREKCSSANIAFPLPVKIQWDPPSHSEPTSHPQMLNTTHTFTFTCLPTTAIILLTFPKLPFHKSKSYFPFSEEEKVKVINTTHTFTCLPTTTVILLTFSKRPCHKSENSLPFEHIWIWPCVEGLLPFSLNTNVSQNTDFPVSDCV